MNLSEVLKKHDELLQKELYTVRGNIVPFGEGTMKIEFSSYAYALVSEQDIEPSLIFPLMPDEDPSGRESKHAIKLLEGTTIELHVKNVVHTFEIEKSTRPFYVDESKEEVVYLDTKAENSSIERRCYKRVYVADCHCCNGGYLGPCYGWVGCGSEWYDRECCD
ncbi:hypothetical protein [Bacillus atrophaeus]|nr:hypothetical protein [Bacillus atrophaeus]KXZ13262.1 hypothetical protein AXI57_16030 [Bacillus atrophaeus]MED4806331.1 hypothetical protein [Bacillus atrophaeus]UFD97641.1 hypothetical protein [Bacillus atrophaeus]GED04448.1 hypothetical protein BAT02nite_40920 [Bacillus atrophaeus]